MLAALSGVPTAASAQVAVEALEVHLNLAPGKATQTGLIPVRNELDRPQQVRVLINDWRRDSLGRNEFLDAGSLPSSCRERLQVFPMSFQVAANSVENVRVNYDAAADTTGCWSIVMFETVEPPKPKSAENGSFLSFQVRTGVKIYVHAERPERAGEISFADVAQGWRPVAVAPGTRPDSTRAWQADLRFVNTGSAHLVIRSSVEIRDLDGLLLQKVAGEEGYLTPGAVRDMRIALPDLAPGTYLALVLVDYGGDEITAAQVEFRIP